MEIKFSDEAKGTCGVCGGEIKEKIVALLEAPMPHVYGPGSKPEIIGEGTDGLVCARCGIKYEFAPSVDILSGIAFSKMPVRFR